MPKKPEFHKHVVDPDQVAQWRLILSPKGKKAWALNELTDKQLTEVYYMLQVRSKSFNEIARYILKNYGDIGDLKYVGEMVSRFSKRVLGARRSASKLKKHMTEEDYKIKGRWKQQERRAKKEISTVVTLGRAIKSILKEIDFWTEMGHQRGDPYDKYLSDLYKNLDLLTSRRDDHMIKAGLMRPPSSQVDINVRQSQLLINQNIDDTTRFTGLVSSFKRRLETIAEPVDATKLIPENTNETQLFREDDQDGDGSIDAEFVSIGDEPDDQGISNH